MASALQHQPKIRVIWAQDLSGRKPALEFMNELDQVSRESVQRSLRILEEHGPQSMGQLRKLKNLGQHTMAGAGNRDLWEIRANRTIRLIGAFRPGGRFVALTGLIKREDILDPSDFQLAKRVMNEFDVASSTSVPFVQKHTPTPNPQFKSQLVIAPKPMPAPAPQKLLKVIKPEYTWSYVKTDDLLAPNAPLALSLCRIPRIHNVVAQEELRPYIEERLKSMPIDSKIALGLLEDNPTHLMLGALWAVEFLMTRELEKEPIVEPEPVVEPVVEPAVVEAVEEKPKFYWVKIADKKCGFKRWLREITSTDLRKMKNADGTYEPKVRARTYKVKSKKWSNEMIYPASEFKNLASLRDPIVIEAISHRTYS